jgi:NhaA family Na+:H+ antiporter
MSYQRKHPLVRTFEWFTRQESIGGLLLIICAVIALIWANSPLHESYTALWQSEITVDLNLLSISKPLLLWINDGLMAIFFLVVGLEIKREVLVGELSTPREAAFPLAAAVGGMVVPAGLYAVINWNTPGMAGWAIPMATDIAFALGVLALLGERAPLALKVFLTALAIVDDLGAVLAIALFYTTTVSWTALGVGALFLFALIAANRWKVQSLTVFVILGIGLWLAILKSGVHATVAGVLLALTIPARRRIEPDIFLEQGRELLDRFEETFATSETPKDEHQDVLHTLEQTSEYVQTPLTRMEHGLHPWVAFFILPVFALANAGVAFSGNILGATVGSTVGLGVLVGLVLGKQVGVTLFAWLAVRMNWASRPTGVTWQQVYGVAWLTGIGFTMSLFIGGLAFEEVLLLDTSKIAILTASLVSGLGGWLLLARASSPAT